MNTNSTSPHPLEEQGHLQRSIQPCVLVIFGATGDLTGRKLIPAIYNLIREGQLPSQFACVGFARRDKSHEEFRAEMRDAVMKYSRTKPIDPAVWDTFAKQLFYHRSEFHESEGYERLRKFLLELDGQFGTQGNRAFYLSTQPSFFPTICDKLDEAKLIYPADDPDHFSRVIVEKPFGHDLKSAHALQNDLLRHMSEKQIYRIDHYLGKETVQNLLVFRFANSLFESLWNNRYIDHIQITVAEDIGIGTRGRFFEEAGYLRDIVQNHMIQLLSIVAMEPPVSLDANAIRDEKVKVLRSLRPFSTQDLEKNVIRSQYGKGFIDGEPVKAYREEENVNPGSSVETFVALRLFIDNWRWDGVPIYLRGGKRLPKRATEIAVQFKDPPDVLFQNLAKRSLPNVLTFRIQPDEGSALRINCKVPGQSNLIQPVKMDFLYGSYFGTSPPEAYERLICDCILGDSTLFAREDEVFQSWRLFTPLLEYWDAQKEKGLTSYESGSWGPKAADEILEREGRKWRLL